MFLSPSVCEDGRIFFVRVRVGFPATSQKRTFLHKIDLFLRQKQEKCIIFGENTKIIAKIFCS